MVDIVRFNGGGFNHYNTSMAVVFTSFNGCGFNHYNTSFKVGDVMAIQGRSDVGMHV